MFYTMVRIHYYSGYFWVWTAVNFYKCNLPCRHGKGKKFKCVVTSAAVGFFLKLHLLCCGCYMDQCLKHLSILAFHVHAELWHDGTALWSSERRSLGGCRRAWSFFCQGSMQNRDTNSALQHGSMFCLIP